MHGSKHIGVVVSNDERLQQHLHHHFVSTGHAPVWERRSALVWGWQVAGADVNACPLELG